MKKNKHTSKKNIKSIKGKYGDGEYVLVQIILSKGRKRVPPFIRDINQGE